MPGQRDGEAAHRAERRRPMIFHMRGRRQILKRSDKESRRRRRAGAPKATSAPSTGNSFSLRHEDKRDRADEYPAAEGEHGVSEFLFQPFRSDAFDAGEERAERNGRAGEGGVKQGLCEPVHEKRH